MWSPTHVQVTVQKAKGLISKGKNGTNDAFVTISLGKEKFQTSVKEKAKDNIEWHERCELLIPKHGNRAEIVLTVLHHNFLGADEFLGCVRLPLSEMDVYKRPQNRWFKLKSKDGKENKERGELEVKVAFTVKAGSLSDLTIGKKEKHKSSLGQISQAAQSIGGSLISISSIGKSKGLKTFATKIGKKIKKPFHHNEGDVPEVYKPEPSKQVLGDADPGVISEAESDDFALDDLSHDGSEVSVDLRPPVGQSVENVTNSHTEMSPPRTPKSAVLEKVDWKSETDLKRPVKMLKG
ncbi:hypothetical protein AAG570_008101 [Ranatra chinensis]|uniref:C2 domain-containing protein n=1 Tax=Ranatra chinensis TaxID=642074 RepID=A0ABD0XTZ8_9HEMI